jgi:hypothetical protein
MPADVKSYAWSTTLQAAVPIGGEVEVPTPGFNNPDSYDTELTGVVHGGTVVPPDQFTATWDANFTHVSILNNTAADWPPGDTIYVTVPGHAFDPVDVEGSFNELEQRVTANEAAIVSIDERVAALEAAAGGLNTSPSPKRDEEHGNRSRNPAPRGQKPK